jgi:hypothetical protein
VTTVDSIATGGFLHDTKITTALLSPAGWIGQWNSTTVANGAYRIVSVGYDGAGRSARGLAIMVKAVNFSTARSCAGSPGNLRAAAITPPQLEGAPCR